MPFRSKKQRAFMFANHPDIAQRWTDEYGGAIIPRKHKLPHTKLHHKHRSEALLKRIHKHHVKKG